MNGLTIKALKCRFEKYKRTVQEYFNGKKLISYESTLFNKIKIFKAQTLNFLNKFMKIAKFMIVII